jgi:hypothetical protein
MGDRGSKSEMFDYIFVKEQRVYGSLVFFYYKIYSSRR